MKGWSPLHWAICYFGSLAAGAAVYWYSGSPWFSIGTIVGLIVVYTFILSSKVVPRDAARKTSAPPATRQQRRLQERRERKQGDKSN